MFSYVLNGDRYCLVQTDSTTGAKNTVLTMDEVAIVYDIECGTMLKHGDVQMVSDWYFKAQADYRKAGFETQADSIAMAVGRFPIDELNKCIDITGYCKFYFDSLNKARQVKHPPRLSS